MITWRAIAGGPLHLRHRLTRLREKTEPDPDSARHMHTIRGEGYVLSTGEGG